MFPVAAVSEPKTIRLADRDFPYLLKRSQQRRSIALTVNERGLIVSAPWRSTERRITGIILDAEDWVLRKFADWRAYPSRSQSWTDGDIIKYLGRNLRLHLSELRTTKAPRHQERQDSAKIRPRVLCLQLPGGIASKRNPPHGNSSADSDVFSFDGFSWCLSVLVVRFDFPRPVFPESLC